MTAAKPVAEWLADITADAFQYDPFNQWVFGDRDTMRDVFRREAEAIYLPHGRHAFGEDDGAAMMWMPPGGPADMPLLPGLRLLAGLMRRRGSGAVRRALAADRAMKRHFPSEPVAYLCTIAVRPEGQGKGLGGRLLRSFLAEADAVDAPACLESSNPDNHGFYAAHGFRTEAIITVAPGAPPLELMRRPAQGRGS